MVPAPTGGWLGSEDEPEPGADLIARMFILILGSVLALAHVYVWKRLVKDTTRPGRGRTILTVAMSGAAALLATTLFGPRFTDVAESGWLAWPGYLWFAVLGYLLLALLILEPVRLALRGWVRRGTPDAPVVPDPPAAQLDRRVFLARTTAAAAGVASVGLVGYGAATALGPRRCCRFRSGWADWIRRSTDFGSQWSPIFTSARCSGGDTPSGSCG